MNLIIQSAAVITTIGVVAGGAYTLDQRHAPMSVMSDLAVSRVLDLVDRAQADPGSPWLCKAIDEELYRFCSKNAGHYLCRPETIRDLKRKAGCG